jgi:hypothetical protein
MHHARAFVAAFIVLSSPNAMADDKMPNVSDEQMACAGAASEEFEKANAANRRARNPQWDFVYRGCDSTAAALRGILQAMGDLPR